MTITTSQGGDAVDVVAVGSGIAGLVAALTAAELGLRVLVLEKSTRLGGTTAVGNGLWVGCSSVARDAGYDDSPEEVLAYLRFLAGDEGDDERIQALAEEAPRALDFLIGCGVRFQVTEGLDDHYLGVAPGAHGPGRHLEAAPVSAYDIGDYADQVLQPFDLPIEATLQELIEWGGFASPTTWNSSELERRRRAGVRARGAGLVVHLVAQLQARGVAIALAEGAASLVLKDGAVVGVRTDRGRTIDAAAGVVLACGGYASNARLARRLSTVSGWRSMYPPSHTGDAMAMASEAGAAVKTIHNYLGIILGFPVPEAAESEAPAFRLAGISEMLCPHTVVVNRRGQRFGDETYFQLLAPALREFDVDARTAVNVPCFLIFDSQYLERFSFAGREVGDPVPDWVHRAATLDELAQSMGIDAIGLQTSIDRFNRFAEQGVDEDYGRPSRRWSLASSDGWGGGTAVNASLGSLNKAPYYGVQLHPSGFVSAGLATNPRGQVLDNFDRPIAGLYAAGDAAAKDDHGIGYQAGCSFASGMTFGHLAGKHIAAERVHPTRAVNE